MRPKSSILPQEVCFLNNMKKLIVVSDWADDSLSCQEVRSATEGYLNSQAFPSISFVSSTPSTVHTTFLLHQVVEVEERLGRPLETVIFVDNDARIQTEHPISESLGSELMIIRLKTGLYIIGPNSGYSFSMIKDRIDAAFHYPEMSKGSQFRSRDMYSRVIAHLIESLQDDLQLDEAHLNLIPELQGYYVGHVDNFGNIKTTISEEMVKENYSYGENIEITIGDITKKVRYIESMFGGTVGELVLYPGSSGQSVNRFMEIAVRRDFSEEQSVSAFHEFDDPRPGTMVEMK